MDDAKWKKYNKLVDRWSRIFKQKFGKLMDYDDISQEAWIAILSAEEYEKEYEATYLGTCIKNHLNKILVDTIYRSRVESADLFEERVEDTHFDTPESLAIAGDLQKKLEIRIKKIPHGMFVWKRMNTMTIREISSEGKALGLPMSIGNVHKIISKIRNEYENLD